MSRLRSRTIAEYGLEDHSFEDDRAPIRLGLYRLPNPNRPPVLMLHGASARIETFAVPEPEAGRSRSLLSHLHRAGFEPWLLDWRASNHVATQTLAREGGFEAILYHADFDRAAAFDFPKALETIRSVRGEQTPIATVGHCMGGAVAAQSLAEGFVTGEELGSLVMLTIGLFYSSSIESRVKLLDRTLERVYASGKHSVVDPRSSDWDNEIEALYQQWPRSRMAHGAAPVPSESEAIGRAICDRVSFMFGPPYREENLVREVHIRHLAEGQFGPMPLRMYLQGTRNLQRGWAARFDAGPRDTSMIDPAACDRFRALDRLTIVTGARNELWHRDSADRMWEWLARAGPVPSGFTKRVLPDYAHQDLLWSPRSSRDVYPVILAGLGAPFVEGALPESAP